MQPPFLLAEVGPKSKPEGNDVAKCILRIAIAGASVLATWAAKDWLLLAQAKSELTEFRPEARVLSLLSAPDDAYLMLPLCY